MKKILIIRSANMVTIDKLISSIQSIYKDSYEIYMLIQKSSVKSFEEKYKNIKYIEKKDGFFYYRELKKDRIIFNRLKKMKFDNIYIPSSTNNFESLTEVFLIASDIKSKGYSICSWDGEINSITLYKGALYVEKYFGELIYFIKLVFALVNITYAYVLYFLWIKVKNVVKHII